MSSWRSSKECGHERGSCSSEWFLSLRLVPLVNTKMSSVWKLIKNEFPPNCNVSSIRTGLGFCFGQGIPNAATNLYLVKINWVSTVRRNLSNTVVSSDAYLCHIPSPPLNELWLLLTAADSPCVTCSSPQGCKVARWGFYLSPSGSSSRSQDLVLLCSTDWSWDDVNILGDPQMMRARNCRINVGRQTLLSFRWSTVGGILYVWT